MNQHQITKMEATVSKIAGAVVELTIRGEKSLTFHTNERNDDAAAKIVKFFTGYKTEVMHDDECGSFVYVDA